MQGTFPTRLQRVDRVDRQKMLYDTHIQALNYGDKPSTDPPDVLQVRRASFLSKAAQFVDLTGYCQLTPAQKAHLDTLQHNRKQKEAESKARMAENRARANMSPRAIREKIYGGPLPKPTKEDRQLHRWLLAHFDNHDWRIRSASADIFSKYLKVPIFGLDASPQMHHSALERHLNGVCWLPTLPLWAVVLHRRGKVKIDGHTRRSSIKTKKPLLPLIQPLTPLPYLPCTLAFRVDVDIFSHSNPSSLNNEQLAAELMEAQNCLATINNEFFGDKLHIESSPCGIAAYGTLILERYETGYMSNKSCNGYISCLESALRQFAKGRGYRCGVECQGGPSTFKKDANGNRVINRRGHSLRAPACPHDGDFEKLKDAVFPIEIIHEISFAVPTLAPAQPTTPSSSSSQPSQPQPSATQKPQSPTSQPTKTKKQKKQKHKRANHNLAPSGNKHSDRCRCVAAARRTVLTADRLGTSVDQLADNEISQIIETANQLYENKGMNGGERDKARDDAWNRILTHQQKTHDCKHSGSGNGSDVLWIIDQDINRLRELAQSWFPVHILEKAQKSNKSIRGEVGYGQIAAVLHCITLNVYQPSEKMCYTVYPPRKHLNGTTSTKAIMEFMKCERFGYQANGSLVSTILNLLIQSGKIRVMEKAYKGQARIIVPANENLWNLQSVNHRTCAWRQEQESESQKRENERNGAGADDSTNCNYISSIITDKYWVHTPVLNEEDSILESTTFDDSSVESADLEGFDECNDGTEWEHCARTESQSVPMPVMIPPAPQSTVSAPRPEFQGVYSHLNDPVYSDKFRNMMMEVIRRRGY